jgi:hypothetical protein
MADGCVIKKHYVVFLFILRRKLPYHGMVYIIHVNIVKGCKQKGIIQKHSSVGCLAIPPMLSIKITDVHINRAKEKRRNKKVHAGI